MLSLLDWQGSVAIVGYEAEDRGWPEIADWSVCEGKFTLEREAYIGVPASWDQQRLLRFLASKPEGCIYRKIAHSPIVTPEDKDLDLIVSTQRVVINGKPYIDMFGLYVYIASRASWEKASDVDLRFNAGLYPYKHLPSEVEMLLNADYDLLNRTSPRQSSLSAG